jgi:hypothetical protein
MMKVIFTVLILARGIMPLELALLLSASSRLRELEPAEPKEEHNFIHRVTLKSGLSPSERRFAPGSARKPVF